MWRTTAYYGLFLSVLGVVFYFVTGKENLTPLIPTFIGLPIFILGLASQKSAKASTLLLIAFLLCLLGLGGSIGGALKLPQLFAGEIVQRPYAVMEQALMAFASVIYAIAWIVAKLAGRKPNQES